MPNQQKAPTPKQTTPSRRRSTPTAGGRTPDNAVSAMQSAHGNAAAQDTLAQTSGPLSRIFNRIVGQPDGSTDTTDLTFTRDQLKTYLDTGLGLAENEWFRGKKLDGVADKLMETFDSDKDGVVSWAEFQAFRTSTLATIAPGAGPDATPDEAAAKAKDRFGALDRGRSKDGKLDYNELHAGSKDSLPDKTKHKDLIAQLAARIALDVADTDQQDESVKDREISQDEWTQAARDLARKPASGD